jgi:cell division septation protein DedD
VAIALVAVASLASDGASVLADVPEPQREPASDVRTAPPTVPPGPESTPSAEAVPPADAPVAVQVASFRDLDRARRFAREMEEETGEPAHISPVQVETGLWYRVLVGDCTTAAEADALIARLRSEREFSFLRLVPLAASGSPPEGS